MPTISSINIALQALLTHQAAIQVIEHNVANVNTPGYHRQQLSLVAAPPIGTAGFAQTAGGGEFGTGVTSNKIQRYKMDFFDTRYRQEISEAKRWTLYHDTVQQLEGILGETGEDGLIPRLNAFWDGWQAVANDPNNLGLRADLKDRAEGLTSAFHRRAVELNNLRTEQDLSVQSKVDEINSVAKQISHLNVEIAKVLGANEQPNDLLDQRDLLLDRLSELTGAVSILQPNGETIVSIGGHYLVMGSAVSELTTSSSAGLKVVSWEDGQSFEPSTGELRGLLDARDSFIVDQLDRLDTLAANLRDTINAQHVTGYGLSGSSAAQGVFFEVPPIPDTHPSMSIRLDVRIDNLANIAASSGDNQPSNGANAAVMFNLKYDRSVFGPANGPTFNDYYNQSVSSLGLTVRQAEQRVKDRNTIADSLKAQRDSVSGVNLDEEAANLVKFQRAYQAAARVLNTVDEMLDKVINGMGLTGR